MFTGALHENLMWCSLDAGFLILGIGKSKKIAKRNGANAMLTLLKQGGVTPGADIEVGDGDFDQGVPLVSSYLLKKGFKFIKIYEVRPLPVYY